ncbi:MAG: aminofutalosine synthase MqnE [Deltaproteobacteria bacterium]|nr:aminofutalosine synthase MqnE [Deltaproteobacteria bacterium]
MTAPFVDPRLEAVFEKVENGHRLTFDDGLTLYQSPDLIGVGRLADRVRRRRHGNSAYYIVNQHLNYTNVCLNQCRFCAFSRQADESGGFTLSMAQVKKQLLDRIDEPICELHIVGGLNPELDLAYYLELLDTVRSVRPGATLKAFTPVEIDRLAHIANLSVSDVISRLKASGLKMLPGGGAEVLCDRIHDELFPVKIAGHRWLEIMESVHDAGLPSNATMLYGHIETLEERVNHLITLRTLQDKTGGFLAFIPLAFHSKNTQLAHLPATTAFDDLKNIAVPRLMLDNIAHIKAYWVMIGEKLAQVALSFGADDLDGTVVEEKISHMAGATSAKGLPRKALDRLIRTAGFMPISRDSFYNPVAGGADREASGS